MRIVILGAPGSGKGTQAALLEKHFEAPHISTGVLFRSAVKSGSPAGLRIQSFIDKGELVPDDLTLEVLEDRLNQADAVDGFILDGYPRNLNQAESLAGLLERMGRPIHEAIQIDVDAEKVIERIARRAAKEGRADDAREVVTNRMRIYQEQTAPVVDYYAEQGLLTRVLGTGTVEEVFQLILSVLEMDYAEASA